MTLEFSGRRGSFHGGSAVFSADQRGEWTIIESSTPWIPLFPTYDREAGHFPGETAQAWKVALFEEVLRDGE